MLGPQRYGTELFRKLDAGWVLCHYARSIGDSATYVKLTDAIEIELLVTQPAVRRKHTFLSTKANKGEEFKPFIERIISSAELAYLDKGLSKDILIIMVSLMRVNEPMRVKILEKFNSPDG